MIDNQKEASVYEDAMSRINSKSQTESNYINNDIVSQYEVCIEYNDYCDDSSNKKSITSNFIQNGQNKIKAENIYKINLKYKY